MLLVCAGVYTKAKAENNDKEAHPTGALNISKLIAFPKTRLRGSRM